MMPTRKRRGNSIWDMRGVEAGEEVLMANGTDIKIAKKTLIAWRKPSEKEGGLMLSDEARARNGGFGMR